MGYTRKDEIIIVHAALGGLLGMVIWPLAAVAARYLRTYYPRWVRVHYIISGFIATPVLIVVFALGRAHKIGDHDNWTTAHFRLGLVLLLLGLLQAIYGTLVHQATWISRTGRDSALRYGHPILGITIVILGYIQVRLGFNQWGKPGQVPHGVIPAWAVLLAVWSAIYLAGLGLLPKQWKIYKAEEGEKKTGESYDVGDRNRSSVAGLTRPSVEA